MVPPFRIVPTAAARATSLLRTLQFTHPPSCPCHSNPSHHHPHISPFQASRQATRHLATPIDSSQEREYAFEMAASSIRFGPGCTKEVGMDVKNLGAKKVCVVTDANVVKLDAMKQVVEGLEKEGVEYVVWDKTRVEPKDSSNPLDPNSIKEAIAFAQPHSPDAFLAVGGGSVIDTAKLMNLYTTVPSVPFLHFVNAPLGAGNPIMHPLKPLIAIPTTAGTGSETTGTAIFDLVSSGSKTGIAHRNLKPTLGICDPLNTRTMPSAVAASSGLDVLCHALESYTAIPYHQRTPRPSNPINRPAYQGANPISDVFSLQALESTIKYLPRAVRDPDDTEAQTQMLLAATLAGVGFGNAGVHLCHGMSYPIASQNLSNYRHPGYHVPDPIIPHGVSVAVTAPSVFSFTAASNPERHAKVASLFPGTPDEGSIKRESAGEVLAEALRRFLDGLGDQPRGLRALGFRRGDLGALVEGTLPQRRVLMLAPGLSPEGGREREELLGLFEGAWEW
ncbi:MAG: hypothetical protein M1834_008516 [Cirrosporium novae-zelandiae]|nr:MAG: hypothetical protein M1834_008516 [Cirrosporium novae-zelandiae]